MNNRNSSEVQIVNESPSANWTVEGFAFTPDREPMRVELTHAGDSSQQLIRVFFQTSKPALLQRYELVFRITFPIGEELRIHHQSLPRLHRRMTVPVSQSLGDPVLPRSDFATPGNYELLAGHQDMLLHPACVVFQPGGPRWTAGPLTQKESFAGYRWKRVDDSCVEITAVFQPLGLPGWKLDHEEFEGETFWVEAPADRAEFGSSVFHNYHAALCESGLRSRARIGPLSRHELFWGTWNDGIKKKVSEQLVLREAAWIARHLPNVRWIQVDDGFHADADPENPHPEFGLADLGVHADAALRVCPKRFPRGMRAMTDDIKAMGLRPMIWFSPACVVRRNLFRERPDLFFPDARLHFAPTLAFPDFSQPEIRTLAGEALDRLFDEWGFEGIKLDFWTYQFLQARLPLAKHEHTNLHWMRWLEKEIRRRLGPDGLMLSCLEPANGDPFRSDVWDMHRIGPDSGGLSLETYQELAVLIASLNGLKQTHRHFWTPDADELSLFRNQNIPDPQWRAITALLVASGACVELAGRLSEQEHDPRMPAFLRAVASVRHGQIVECPGYNWIANEGSAPDVWWRRDDDGGSVLGIINWHQESKEFQVPLPLRGRPALDLFAGTTQPMGKSVHLNRGDGSLWRVNSVSTWNSLLSASFEVQPPSFKLKLSSLFCDHAVVQRGIPVPVWGWGKPLGRVKARLGQYAAESMAGADGKFLIRLPAMPAGGPYDLEVTAEDGSGAVVAKDVWVGEVWLASGQSNMELTLDRITGKAGEVELRDADIPGLRMINIPVVAYLGRQSDVKAEWQVATPESARKFSAAGYHFGKRLHEELGVAVGIMNASVGGTPVEAWTSREALVRNPDTAARVANYEAMINAPATWADGEKLPDKKYPADPGNTGEAKGWAGSDGDDGGWAEMQLPQTWQEAGHAHCGVFWFRKTVEVPAAWVRRDLVLHIGAVDKQDTTYFNGVKVGATGKDLEDQYWCQAREYHVPARLVQAGRNVIAVRVFSFVSDGGMIGPANQMRLGLDDKGAGSVPLAGVWRYRVEHDLGVIMPPSGPHGPVNGGSPHVLYDSMIAPLIPYGLRGAIWYQGEGNTAKAWQYHRLLKDMIRCWRWDWGQGDFPFLIVQLANYKAAANYQDASLWARLREAQLQILSEPATGLAVTIDIGEAMGIHPQNKADVGRRLAQWALSATYGLPVVASGPLYAGMAREGSTIRLRFDHVGGGLVARSGALRTFVMAGSDQKFHDATAVIDGGTVVVSCPDVPEPMAARYAWADNPEGCNLYNAEGLPASPFRTDTWP